MREIPLSRCEREFVNKAIVEDTRLDGRDLLQARPVKLFFGSNWGCCLATFGQTRVVANVSCDIQPPKSSRPNEGMLYLNVELNPMAAPHFEAGRQSEAGVFITTQLEKCFKDSKCLDLESLCIVADKKVWNIRVDVNVINHDGNLIDCACIATLAALSHFHRPDVTTDGEEVKVHSFAEKDPLPLTLYHLPVCVSFATFESGRTVLDPTFMEERLGVAQLSLAVNSYREVCSLHFDYTARTGIVTDVIAAVSNKAAHHAAALVRLIKEEVKRDVQARYDKTACSENTRRIKDSIASDRIMTMMSERISIRLAGWNAEKRLRNHDTQDSEEEDVKMHQDFAEESSTIISLGQGSAQLVPNKTIGEGGPSTWNDSESSEDEDSDDIEMVGIEPRSKKVLDEIELSGDSEEETTGTISTKDLMFQLEAGRGLPREDHCQFRLNLLQNLFFFAVVAA